MFGTGLLHDEGWGEWLPVRNRNWLQVAVTRVHPDDEVKAKILLDSTMPIVLGALTVIVLTIGPEVRGLKPGR
jgi:hypothetical protein